MKHDLQAKFISTLPPLALPLEWIQAAPSGFWSRVLIGAENECWIWQRSLNSSGYGNYSHNGERIMAHLVAFRAAHGHMPDGYECGHRCHNPACLNPHHLKTVTSKENAAERGLRRRGRPARILTEAIVRAARELRRLGWKIKTIAEKFAVRVDTMSLAISGKNWAWVQ